MFPRFYDHHFDRNPFWKDHLAYVPFCPHSHWHLNPNVRYSRLSSLAYSAAQIRVVQSQGPGHIGDHGFSNSCIWMPRLLGTRASQVRRTDNSWRNVCSRCVFWSVRFARHVGVDLLTTCTGSVYGAFQGYARAFYAELLPPGEEARWYGLFSITDKVPIFFPCLFLRY